MAQAAQSLLSISNATSDVFVKAESVDSETEDSDRGKSEEELVFGATGNAEEIANHLCQCLEQALALGVSSLPMLDKPDLLVEKLLEPHLKNIDVFEIYCQRNIFSLNMYNLSQRRAILNVLSQSEKGTMAPPEEQDKVPAVVFHEPVEPLIKIPSQEGVPPAQELQNLKVQTEALRQRLAVLKAQQSILQSELKEWKVTKDLLESSQFDRSKLHESVSAAVIGSEGLEQFHQKSLELMKQLEEKRAHDDNSDRLIRPKQQLTLEQRFELERRVLSGASVDTLKQLNNLISRGKENEIK